MTQFISNKNDDLQRQLHALNIVAKRFNRMISDQFHLINFVTLFQSTWDKISTIISQWQGI